MMVPPWSCQCTKKTVLPSRVKAGAAFDPVPQSVSPEKTLGTGALGAAARPLHTTATASTRPSLLRSINILHPVFRRVSANSTRARRRGERGSSSAFVAEPWSLGAEPFLRRAKLTSWHIYDGPHVTPMLLFREDIRGVLLS